MLLNHCPLWHGCDLLYAALGGQTAYDEIPERFVLLEGEDLQTAVGVMPGIEDHP